MHTHGVDIKLLQICTIYLFNVYFSIHHFSYLNTSIIYKKKPNIKIKRMFMAIEQKRIYY